MATTTNYSWTTPDDTALVKDGAAAIRSLGTAIDTTVFNNASAAIAKTIVDAKGDIIAATAADTVSRLAVGANDTVLTADSSTATGLKWAAPASGGMTSIASGSLSGTSISLQSISGTYNNLVLLIKQPKVSASAGGALMVRTNNDSTSTYTIQYWVTGTTTSFTAFTTRTAHWANNFTGTTSANNDFVAYTFLDYANATTLKHVQINAVNGTNASFGIAYNTGITAAITRLDILDNNGATFNGGTYVLYGVK